MLEVLLFAIMTNNSSLMQVVRLVEAVNRAFIIHGLQPFYQVSELVALVVPPSLVT